MFSKVVSLLIEIGGLPSHVVEIGTRHGALLKELQSHGHGASSGAINTHIQIELVNLADALPDPPSASLSICLEGAETISPGQALGLVQWLTTSADLVVFAAALPGQMRIDHIHCQPTLYWRDLFELCGFRRYDILRQHLLSDANIPWQQRQNMVLYARKESKPELELRLRYPHNFLPPEFELVHHTMITNALLFRSAKPETPRIGELLRFLSTAIKESILCRVSNIGEKLRRLRYN